MLKRITLLIASLHGFLPTTFSQSSYDDQIVLLAKELAKKVDTSFKKRIGIMDFVNDDKIVTKLGTTITDDLSGELANHSGNQKKFEVFERSQLDQIFKEKNLIKNYDSRDAKELGRLNAVDILIIGTIMPFEEFNKQYFKLSIKLLDTKNGSIISSLRGQLEKNSSLDGLYENKTTASSKITNNPTNETKKQISVETSVKTQSNHCDNNLGDYCFKNMSSRGIVVNLLDKASAQSWAPQPLQTITIEPSKVSCFYDINADSYIIKYQLNGPRRLGETENSKSIRVEKCIKNPPADELRATSNGW